MSRRLLPIIYHEFDQFAHIRRLFRQFDNHFNAIFAEASKSFDERAINHVSNLKTQEIDQTNDKIRLKFNLSGFKPENIKVKLIDDKLHIHAVHQEKSESKSLYSEYNENIQIPKGLNVESIKTTLNEHGLLTLEADQPKLEANEKVLNIEHVKSEK